ncbi:MAG: DsbE family thiol:disulfide interchange protein [Pseudomonadales bacterium]|nr:DsbE family thiol:disulfide interchange protein [Pseudomonadales bacterium]
MTKNKTLIYLLPLLMFFALAGLLFSSLGNDPRLLPSAKLGKMLPDFALPSLYGQETLTAESVSGDAFLLNVWATWCPSCRVEHPVLNQLAEKGVDIIGLNYKDDEGEARAYLKQLGNPYKVVVRDDSGDLGLDLGVYGAPETYIVNSDNRIVYRHVGIVTMENWQSTLRPIYNSARKNTTLREVSQ